jgi:hypothetical protein
MPAPAVKALKPLHCWQNFQFSPQCPNSDKSKGIPTGVFAK